MCCIVTNSNLLINFLFLFFQIIRFVFAMVYAFCIWICFDHHRYHYSVVVSIASEIDQADALMHFDYIRPLVNSQSVGNAKLGRVTGRLAVVMLAIWALMLMHIASQI